MTQLKQLSMTVMSMLLLVSCVTINIYFPAAAAEKAADRIIEDIWGPETQPSEQEVVPEQQSQWQQPSLGLAVLNWFISPAAAEPDLNINSAAVTGLKKQMRARHASLKPYLDNGAVGLTDKGLLAAKNIKAVSLKDRNKVKGLIADDNKDRLAMYAEIARANGHPEWQADIQATFARRWVNKAAAGWWYQSKGQWQQK